MYLSPGCTASTRSLWENNMIVCGVCPGGMSSEKEKLWQGLEQICNLGQEIEMTMVITSL